ncbi:hypothetical protein [Wolbachia endosymbiont (group A) of Cheilosia soror]|nr:hypothetical protein [Wolbachia endosymbiont (group A) of Cheilosia soror]
MSTLPRVSFAFFLFGKFFNIYTEGVIPARDAGIQSFCNLIENVFLC